MTTQRASASQKRPADASEASDGSEYGAGANGARMGGKAPSGVSRRAEVYWEIHCAHGQCKRRLPKAASRSEAHNQAILAGWEDAGGGYRCPWHRTDAPYG